MVVAIRKLPRRPLHDTVGYRVLFEQKILTDPSRKRLVIVTSVRRLTETLGAFDHAPAILEHIYDY